MGARIRYATSSDGAHIAYSTHGEGPPLLTAWGSWSNIEVVWDHPLARGALERLGEFCTLIQFDKRGTGLSDRSCDLPTYDRQLDDALAVLDAAGFDDTAVSAGGDAAHLGILLAAAHPDRCTKLALWAPKLRFIAEDGLSGGVPAAHVDAVLGLLTDGWGTGITAPTVIPSATDDVSLQWWAKLERHSLSPGSVAPLFRMVAASDVRAVLGSVGVPTLVVHRRDDRYAPIEHGRMVAASIRDARLVELDGCDHAAWVGDWDPYFDALEEHVTGAHHASAADRVLATVLFTDIVGSTERAAEGGDKRWTRRLRQHDAVVGDQIRRHRGELVKSTGDGVLATFDGPTRAVECASAIVRDARALGLELRAGVHTGEIERRGGDIAGLTVHIAARLEALADPGTVAVSQTVVDLVAGSGLTFRSAGERTLKGVPGRWRIHALT